MTTTHNRSSLPPPEPPDPRRSRWIRDTCSHAETRSRPLRFYAAPVRAEPMVGLAERRAIAAYREGRYPAQEKAIQDAAGFPVPVEVAWDQLTIPGDAKYYSDQAYFQTIFEPLAAGLKQVCRDQMGRDAVKAKLTGVRIRFDDKTAPASKYFNGLKFENGIFDVNWRPFSNVADFKDRVVAVVRVLEQNL